MVLTDAAIRNAKPGAKAIKLADSGGMRVAPSFLDAFCFQDLLPFELCE